MSAAVKDKMDQFSARLEGAIARGRPLSAAELDALETEAALLCDLVTNLPATEAKAIQPDIIRAIQKLDALTRRLEQE